VSQGAGRHRRADLALAGVTVIWGITFVTVKSALADASPILLLALRFCLATAALGLLFRRHLSDRSGLLPGLVAGSLLYASFVFQTVGLRFTTPAKSAFLTGLTVPMVPLLASLVYRRRPRAVELMGAALATAGLTLMTLRVDTLEVNRGDALTLLCAAGFAAHIVALGHFSVRASYESLAVAQIGTAALLSLATFWWVETPFIRWTFGIGFAVILTGLLATALAFTVQAWAQQYTSAARAAIIFALEPVVAWVASFLVTGEELPPKAVFGAVLILAGIVLVELKPARTPRHPPD
jgi:drug/metabolite transporter (DMT)-like permease